MGDEEVKNDRDAKSVLKRHMKKKTVRIANVVRSK